MSINGGVYRVGVAPTVAGEPDLAAAAVNAPDFGRAFAPKELVQQ
jgi:hypothetical protein